MIAVRPGNPKNITSLADLAKPGTTVVLCDDPVPCGAAGLKAAKAAGVTLRPVSKEQNVGGVLAKVQSGDADAGLVYRTDVRGAGTKVTGVAFPEATQAINNYPVAVLKDTGLPVTARDFAEYIRTGGGREVLATNGFGKP
jgi:molybdate transport system substrate-binding protein